VGARVSVKATPIKRAPKKPTTRFAAFRRSTVNVIKSARKALKPKPLLDARKELAIWNSATLTVGIHEAEGSMVKGSLTVAQIMTVHEFGSDDGRIPMRSWLRGWFDESQEQMSGLVRDMTKQIVKGKLKAKSALARLGSIAVAELQARWARTPGDWAPLAESTIKRKKSSKPLIDTGQSRTSVTYTIRYK
jgi:hypothetical protein